MQFDKQTRQRLAALTRQGMQARPATEPSPAPAAERIVTPAQAPLQVGLTEERHGPLEALLPGAVQTVAEGEYYELRTPVAAYGDWAAAAVRHWLEAQRHGGLEGLLPAPGNLPPEGFVFMDTETTGLGNEPLFLVGLLLLEEDEPTVVQLLARHYGEEPAVLAEATRRLQAAGLIVTYNGATFDLPYVRNRLRYHRLPAPRFACHLDLLPVARRKLGRSLGNCKLQTLERHLCGRERVGDIPGAEIPQAYHDFVAEGDAVLLRHIITHNSLDMITLAELQARLA